MTQTKSIKITEKVAKKSGSTKHGPWTLWILVDEAGDQYSTFNGDLYEVGKEYKISFIKSVDGTYIRNSIQDGKSAKSKGQQEQIITALNEIRELLQVLINRKG